MNQSDSNRKTSRLEKIYKILETILASEIILCIYGALTIAYWFPAPLVIFYWVVIPYSILITGFLFLLTRHLRR